MKILDKISEAYFGSMGDNFARKTRERIHWVCSKVKGVNVLDIGCSQGITEIILSKEGKKIVGIDIEEEQIEFAKKSIQNENITVQNNIEFQACSIFDFEHQEKFDTVILSEVMEHFTNSSTLLEKVSSLMTEFGQIIITVPFGINDFIDHKKTYYCFNLIEEVETHFQISEVKFFGKWIGLVASKDIDSSSINNLNRRDLIKQLENNFYSIERQLIDELNIKIKGLNQLSSKIEDSTKLLNQLREENKRLKQENELSKQLREDNNKLKQQINELLSKDNENINEIKNLKKIIEDKNNEMLTRLDSEEATLERYKDAIYNNNLLEAKYTNIFNKYELLSKAKLGRLTLNYWKYKKRIPKDF